MINLRDRLKELDPNLYDTLERSWDIAHEQWLPALGSKGSYNSYPHLRNLENHLNRLVDGFETSPGSNRKLDLASVEIYLILAAILFHDIGRIVGDSDHGKESRKLILERSGDLGIYNSELAECLGRICEYHNSKDMNLRNELNNIVIDPYGEVRQLFLASLLKLVDYLDSAFIRVVPDYLLHGVANLDPIGAFRRVISGVYVDHESRMIRTVLRDSLKFGDSFDDRIDYVPNSVRPESTKILEEIHKEEFIIVPSTTPGANLLQVLPNAFRIASVNPTFSEVVEDIFKQTGYPSDPKGLKRRHLPIYDAVAGASDLNKDELPDKWPTGVELNILAVARQLLFAKRPKDEKDPRPWPPSLLVSIVLGNLRENIEALRNIRSDLASVGMQINAWVLDHREHLYNEFGEETYEPILDQDYLCNLADALYKLSTIPGKSNCEYVDLAAKLHESDNMSKVIIGVKRLSILTRSMLTKGQYINAIRCGSGFCNWNVVHTNMSNGCLFVSLKHVIDKIRMTGRPM